MQVLNLNIYPQRKYSTYKKSNVTMPNVMTPKKNIPFRAHYDYFGEIQQFGDGVRYKLGSIHNYTELNRDMFLFKELPFFLKNEYPNGVKIYDYACSRGHEASSIVMGLFDGLSENNAKKYLPVLAYDKNPNILKLNEKNTLKLEDDEEKSVSDTVDNYDIKTFLRPLRKTPDGQKLYKMTDKLSNNIKFECRDIFEDAKNGKFSKEPCVIFFRNAWQYLTQKGTDELAKNLFENVHSKSTVIIGNMDIKSYGKTGDADVALTKAGFKKVNCECPIKMKNHNLQYAYDNSKDERLSSYAYQKV